MVIALNELRETLDEENHLLLLENLAEHVDDAVTITRTEENGGWEILYVNPAFTRLTGYRAEEVLGHSPHFLQGPATDRRVLRHLHDRLEQGEPFRGKTTNYRKNGEPFLMDWEVVTFRDEAGRKRFYMALQKEAGQA